MSDNAGFSTRAIHAGQDPDPLTGAVVPPIYQVSTYKQDGVGGLRGGYEYSRSANPTRTALEECLAALEGGSRGFAFSSGLAAEDTLLRAVTGPGQHAVIPNDAYGGTYRLFAQVAEPWGLASSPTDLGDLDAVRAAIRPGQTSVLWAETPTNPLLSIADIAALAEIAHDAGALLVVDNTFATPYLQSPLALGADVVVHSTTKYCGGHSDVVGGALVTSRTPHRADLDERIGFHQNAIGGVSGPFDAWLVLRGLRTLALRMDRHCDNAERVAAYLAEHPRVVARAVPRPPGASGPRGRRPADAPVRRHDQLPPARRRRGGPRRLQAGRGLHPRGVAGRGGVADRASGPDDPRERGRQPARGARRPGPALGRHRGRRGPAGRPRPRPVLSRHVGSHPGRVLCVDFGSTFTKAALVDGETGELVATGSHPTTIGTDVLDGYRAIRDGLAGERVDEVLACSSAGGGLRLAVVGYERQVTAEAGHRVGLSAGAKVVHVSAGPLDSAGVSALRAARPDVILLVGGTDGGNAEVLLHNARRLGTARVAAPVVLAGNAEVSEAAAHELVSRRRTVVPAANVLPRIGVLEPRPARAAIRDVFIRHVIGGKHLSRSPDFAAMVRAATPDVVLAGVEVLADGAPESGVEGAGDVLVVDIGGATTDVYSVVTPDGEDAVLHKEVVATLWRARTVEGDLGMRWNAAGVVEAARAERLLTERGRRRAGSRRTRPGWPAAPDQVPPPGSPEDRLDLRLAELAVTVALRRHGRPAGPGAEPRPLRDVGLVVGSGGVLRHHGPAERMRVLAAATADHGGGWRVPAQARVVVDGAVRAVRRRAARHERVGRPEARGGAVGCRADSRGRGRIDR